jgi:membrane protease YdiL (CAAX protease family)
MPWDFLLILVVLGVIVPWRGTVRVKELLARPHLNTADRLLLYASTIAFQWIAVAVVAWRCAARGVGLAQLALAVPTPERTTAIAAALTVFLGGNQVFSLHRLARLPAERRGFMYQLARKLLPQNRVEMFAFVALAVTVALCEEFLYRGFVFAAFERSAVHFLPIAVAGSSVFFALAHSYQGRRGVITTLFVGVIFALARIGTESLVPSIVAHLFTDLIGGLSAPRILAGTENRRIHAADRAQAGGGAREGR